MRNVVIEIRQSPRNPDDWSLEITGQKDNGEDVLYNARAMGMLNPIETLTQAAYFVICEEGIFDEDNIVLSSSSKGV